MKSDAMKNTKQVHLQKITVINLYQQRGLLWTKYEHSYSKVYKVVSESGEFYVDKSCKSLFHKETWIHN